MKLALTSLRPLAFSPSALASALKSKFKLCSIYQCNAIWKIFEKETEKVWKSDNIEEAIERVWKSGQFGQGHTEKPEINLLKGIKPIANGHTDSKFSWRELSDKSSPIMVGIARILNIVGRVIRPSSLSLSIYLHVVEKVTITCVFAKTK